MELADTSVWTNRHKAPAVRFEFDDAVVAGEIATCPMVVPELLWSSKNARSFEALRRELGALVSVPIDGDVWSRATEVFGWLAAAGPLHQRRVKLPDLLIAAAAEAAGLVVCHYDRDFDVIAGATGQPVRAIAPLGSL